MGDALTAIAAMIAGRALPATALDWSDLRYQHTAAIRSRLAKRYAPATVNKMLAAPVLYGTAVRRAEAVALDVADFDTKTGELLVRRGKGRKGRVVYATNGGMDALRA